MQTGVIKVSVLYPNGQDKTFDMDYYINKHIPMVLSLLGDKVKLGAIERGLRGSKSGTVAPFVVMAHLYFNSMHAFEESYRPNEEEILKDMTNYTNITPVIQVGEVIV